MELPARPLSVHRMMRRGFTLIELLVVISLIAFLSGMFLGISYLASSKMRIARVQGELAQIETAISFYKEKYGVYPPGNQMKDGQDFPIPGSSATNQLVLELTGCLVTNNQFYSPSVRDMGGREKLLSSEEMRVLFGAAADGVLNASEKMSKTRNFIENFSSRRFGRITNAARTFTVDMLKVPADAPVHVDALDNQGKRWRMLGSNNPWHYNVTDPTNNPDSYDLWAEFQVGKQGDVQDEVIDGTWTYGWF